MKKGPVRKIKKAYTRKDINPFKSKKPAHRTDRSDDFSCFPALELPNRFKGSCALMRISAKSGTPSGYMNSMP